MSSVLEMDSFPHNEQSDLLISNLRRSIEPDIIIECDGEEIHVHRLILIHSSDYFKRMFQSSFQESSSGSIKFPTIGKDTMKIVIDFLYLSRNPLPTDQIMVAKLFQAAHLLEINPLMKYCTRKMIENLNLENYLDVWLLNDVYQDEDLIIEINNFLKQNLEQIVKHKSFVTIPYVKVKYLLEKMNESKMKAKDYMVESILKWVKHEHAREIHFQEMFKTFNDIQFTDQCINHLINDEPLVKENAEVLLVLLKHQMKTKNTNKPNTVNNNVILKAKPSANVLRDNFYPFDDFDLSDEECFGYDYDY